MLYLTMWVLSYQTNSQVSLLHMWQISALFGYLMLAVSWVVISEEKDRMEQQKGRIPSRYSSLDLHHPSEQHRWEADQDGTTDHLYHQNNIMSIFS